MAPEGDRAGVLSINPGFEEGGRSAGLSGSYAQFSVGRAEAAAPSYVNDGSAYSELPPDTPADGSAGSGVSLPPPLPDAETDGGEAYGVHIDDAPPPRRYEEIADDDGAPGAAVLRLDSAEDDGMGGYAEVEA